MEHVELYNCYDNQQEMKVSPQLFLDEMPALAISVTLSLHLQRSGKGQPYPFPERYPDTTEEHVVHVTFFLIGCLHVFELNLTKTTCAGDRLAFARVPKAWREKQMQEFSSGKKNVVIDKFLPYEKDKTTRSPPTPPKKKSELVTTT